MIQKITEAIKKHKIISGFIVIAIGVGVFMWVRALGTTALPTRYVLTQVEKGTISTTISGSGQVSATNQVDIKAKASGDVTKLSVKNGQEVKAGVIIAQLNAKDAYKSVRDANANLESAKLSLEKLQKPVGELTVMQAENNLAQAQESKEKAVDDLQKAYDDGFTAVANVFLDLPGIMTGLTDIFFDDTLERGQQNIDWYANQTINYNDVSDKAESYRDDVHRSNENAQESFTANFDDYKSASRSSDTDTIEKLISETYDTVKLTADTVKTANNYIDLVESALSNHGISVPAGVSTHQSSLDTYTSETNSHLSSLLNIKNTIRDAKSAIINADRTIAENTTSLADTKEGTDPLDIQSAELTVKQRQNALYDAQEKLADYTVRAPFDGVIASVDVQKGDSVSSGGAVATIITKQQIAKISLNELDAAKVKAGQKVILTFDAIEDLSITGSVAEVDSIGTVSQGVVSYNITIVFDTQDDRVKSGMSTSATIIIDTKADVLVVPVSAVKSQGGISYVDIPAQSAATMDTAVSGIELPAPPVQQMVEVGLINDTSVEIVSGLTEGQYIVSRTISQSGTQSSAGTQSAPSLFGSGTTGNRSFSTGGTAATRINR